MSSEIISGLFRTKNQRQSNTIRSEQCLFKVKRENEIESESIKVKVMQDPDSTWISQLVN